VRCEACRKTGTVSCGARHKQSGKLNKCKLIKLGNIAPVWQLLIDKFGNSLRHKVGYLMLAVTATEGSPPHPDRIEALFQDLPANMSAVAEEIRQCV
jgi:hypothetical protein